jgi:hypothetical protein
MRAVLLGLLILSVSGSNALAFGAIASGENGSFPNFTSASSEDTYNTANALSLRRCQDEGLANCVVRWNFRNICISVGLGNNNVAEEGDGATALDAREQMHTNCTNAGAGVCTETVLACDQTPSAGANEEDAVPEVTTPPTTVDQLLTYIQLPDTVALFAGLITVSLLTWIFVSIVSATPIPILKKRVLLSVWICGPAALQFALWLTGAKAAPSIPQAIYLLSLWTDTFAALILGGGVRRRLSPEWKPPDPLSLPVATFAFTIAAGVLIWLFAQYVLVPQVIGCIFAPNTDADACQRLRWENVGAGLTALLALLGCGVLLPANSNLVLANNRLEALIRRSLANFRRKRLERHEKAKQELIKSEEVDSYPVPVLYAPTAADAMRLKLKRSQRSSLFGKVIFVLDARMELTEEELDLVRKYRLGGDVVYESSDRKRRKEATQAHLEMTKGGPGLRDSPGSQAWGIARSFFWMGRAGLSAATAALSLRITIDSLMSGVHVECKSMGELLEAERAIREAAQNLRGYIDVARTFDGREEIVEL